MLDRRTLLKTAGAGLTLAAGPELVTAATGGMATAADSLFAAPPIETVRVGIVGVGHQGIGHVKNFVGIPGAEVRAVCDVIPELVTQAQAVVTDAGQPRPAGYADGPDAYRRMIDTEDLDLVVTATPWELHAPVALSAMRAGKHAATEIPMAVRIDELWELVDTAEATGRHCVMLENCCYDRTEMVILNMVRQGIFGELVHGEGGYLHDLRFFKLTDFYPNRWRLQHSITRNGDLYPTHGLGPIAQCMNINRGNQFDYLVSMATRSQGLNLWAAEHIGPDSPEATQPYALGDVVTTMIRTLSGQTISLTHDTNLTGPYSRNLMLRGTKAVVRKYPDEKIHIEGRTPEHAWETPEADLATYDHPLWRALADRAVDGGHRGMDYIEDFRLVECLRAGTPMDMDVYDGAAWSAVSELSERSINARSGPVDFPDFTRGAWQNRPPLGIVSTEMATSTSP